MSGGASGLAAGVIGFVAIRCYDTKPRLGLAESSFVLECLQRVVDDGTVAGAVNELPHPEGDGALASDEMREVAADGGACVVDGALGAGEEDAGAVLVALEVEQAIVAGLGVVLAELCVLHAKEFGQLGDVAVEKLNRCLTAAVGANGAVDLRLDVLGDAAEFELLKTMTFQVFAKTLVFRAFLLAEPADLDQVVNHYLYYRV